MDIEESSKESLVSLFGNVPGIVYRCKYDDKWTMEFLSDKCEDITGYKPEELIDNKKKAWAELIHPDFREKVREKITNAVEKKERFKITYKIITKKGKERWVWEQGNGVQDEEGNIEKVEGVISDVTEEIKNRKKLKERKEKIKELYKAGAKLTSCRTREKVYERAVESAKNILGFYTSILLIKTNGNLEVKQATSESSFNRGDQLSLDNKDHMMVNSFLEKETTLIKDIPSRDDVGVTQSGLKSGLSVPVGEIGLFVAASKEKKKFDEFDLEMTKILSSHINEAIKRIESEKKVKELYKASTELEACRTKKEIYEVAIEHAGKILGFYASGIFINEGDELVGKCFTKESLGTKGIRYPNDEEIKGLSFTKQESYLIDDLKEWDEVSDYQEGLKSGLSVPIGEKGVFQAVSKEKGYYDEFDLEMAKLLAMRICEAVERIDQREEKELILNTVQECIVYLDENLNVRWANDEVEESFNCSMEDLKDKKCYEVFYDKENICKDCPAEKAVETKTQQESIKKFKDTYWILRASPRVDDEGNVQGVVEVALDITDRKKAEKKLKDNLNKIEKVLEASSQLEKQTTRNDIYQTAVDVAENILDIKMSGVFVEEGDKLVLKAESSGIPDDFDPALRRRDKDKNMLGEVWNTKKSDITNDFEKTEDVESLLDGYKSGLSVPIGDKAVFQAMSKEKNYFDESDLSILELLLAHVNEAVERVELLEELKRSEERYRKLFERSPISIWEEDFSEVKNYLDDLIQRKEISDIDAYLKENPDDLKKCSELVKVKDVNQATLDIYNAESKEDLKNNLDKVFKEKSFDALRRELVAIANEEETFTTSDMVNYTLDGEEKHFYFKWTTLGEDSNDYSDVIVSLVDITELKETQRKLRESEKKYHSIFENTGTAMLIIEEDKTISLANDEFSQLVGYPKEEIVGDMKWTKFVADEDRERMIEYHKKRRDGSSERPPRNYEFTLINSFGDAKDVIIEIGLIPETDRTVASLMDVTDFKQTFGALRESQEAFRILFENCDQPVVMINKDLEVKEANEKFYDTFGWEEGELTEKSIIHFTSEKDEEKFKSDINSLLSVEKNSIERKIRFITRKNEEVPAKVEYGLVRNHEDIPLYVLCTLNQIEW